MILDQILKIVSVIVSIVMLAVSVIGGFLHKDSKTNITTEIKKGEISTTVTTEKQPAPVALEVETTEEAPTKDSAPSVLVGTDTDSQVAIEDDFIGLSFTTQLVNQQGLTLAGHKVSLFDVTDERFFVAEQETNAYGEATFSLLPVERNYSVFIDGEPMGYTFRNSEPVAMGRTFVLDQEITGSANRADFAQEPAIVTVYDQNGEPVADQTVALMSSGKELAQATTDAKGQVSFKQVYQGVYYDLTLNGEVVQNFARSGENTSLYTYVEANEEKSEPVVADGNKGEVRFEATAINDEYHTLSDVEVALYDITYSSELVAKGVTNEQGVVAFTGLKTSHNYSVMINGDFVGYTFRSSEDKASLAHTFTIQSCDSKEGDKVKTVSSTVNVANADDIALAGKTVSLMRQGQVVATATTNEQGNAQLSNLIIGEFYDIYVDGTSVNNFVQGGSNQSVFIAE